MSPQSQPQNGKYPAGIVVISQSPASDAFVTVAVVLACERCVVLIWRVPATVYSLNLAHGSIQISFVIPSSKY